jgi:glycerate kinase
VLDTLHFDSTAAGVDLVVTGEGKLDQTTLEGKAPGSVWRRCQELGVRCVLFGGLVELAGPEFDIRPLSGSPSQAAADLVALGEALAAA